MNTAIIVAAGSSKRLSHARPKQFVEILGRPLIGYTLERFETCPVIDEIILVLSDDGRDYFDSVEEQFGFSKLKKLVSGGATRARSVRNGFDAIDQATADIVAVHDGARPLVSVDEITQTVSRAAQTGAACLVAAVTDTIKEIDGSHIIRTIDRDRLRRALTPQAFRYDLLRKAFAGVDLDESVTDECYLVEKLGVEISFVEGSSRNIKITHNEDIVLAAAFLRERH